MGKRIALLAMVALALGFVFISRHSNKRLSSIHAVDSGPISSSESNEESETNSESKIVDHSHGSGRSIASVIEGKLERKLNAKAVGDSDEIVNRQPTSIELKSFSLALEDRHWKIWDGVTGIPEHAFQNDRKGNVVGRINGYILEKSKDSLTLESFSSKNPMVVYNERLGAPGVITGTLTMKIKYKDELKDILDTYNLKTLDSFSEINLYYVTAEDQPFDLSELFKALQKDSRIEKVEPEILNRQYEKR